MVVKGGKLVIPSARGCRAQCYSIHGPKMLAILLALTVALADGQGALIPRPMPVCPAGFGLAFGNNTLGTCDCYGQLFIGEDCHKVCQHDTPCSSILRSCLSSSYIIDLQSISRRPFNSVECLTSHRPLTKTYKRQFLASPTECSPEELLGSAPGDDTFVPYFHMFHQLF